ncbi:MAG: hypothetical protein DDG60_00250 [Anaerolineae bacterium]|nr:MAG: hypothetical protein DDG60_00250 [Anaerolineae bacterium]
MTIFLTSLLLFIPKTLLASFLLHRLWPERTPTSLLLKLTGGFALGIGLSSALMLFGLRAGISPCGYARTEFWLSLLALALLSPRFYRFAKEMLRRPAAPFGFINELRSPVNWLTFLLLVAFLLSTTTFLYYAARHPHGLSDAWTIWNNLARYLYRSNDPTLLFDTTRYFRIHYDYPALYSLNVAATWCVLGSDSTRAPIAFTFLGIFAIPVALWAAVARHKGYAQSKLAALIALLTPSFGLTIGQYADVFVALYILLTGIFLSLYQHHHQRRFLLLAGLFAGLSAWTKNEGMLFLLSSGIIVAGLTLPRQLRHFAVFLAGAAAPLLVVVFFKASVSLQSDLASAPEQSLAFLLDPSRYLIISRAYLNAAWQFGDWPVGPVLALYAVLTGFSPRLSTSLPLLSLILLQQAGYFGIYLLTPHDLHWHLHTSLTRLLLQTYPLFLFWLFLALNAPEMEKTEPCCSPSTSATPT